MHATVRPERARGNASAALAAIMMVVSIGLHSLVAGAGDAPTKPDSSPLIHSAAMEYHATNGSSGQVTLRGVVLAQIAPMAWYAYDDGAFRIEFDQPQALQRGQLVQATGTPIMRDGRPWLEQSQVKILGTGTIPTPKPLRAPDALAKDHDAEYITLTGRVVGYGQYEMLGGTNEVVLLDSEGVSCKAIFPAGTHSDKLYKLGTVAAFTGICRYGNHVDGAPMYVHHLHVIMDGRQSVHVIWSNTASWTIFGLVAASVSVVIAGILFRWRKARLLRDERKQAEEELRRLNASLERRVEVRTAELCEANERLHAEITTRERAEENLRVSLAAEKELNQLKSSFVSMVSHEFRTPLEVILSSSFILERYFDRLPAEKRATQLRAVRKSVRRMNDLIDDVLLLGKFDAGVLVCNPSPVDLVACCRRAVAEIESASMRAGAIHFTATDINGDATADEGLLLHILTNILGNGIKYSAPGSPLEFAVTRRGLDAEFVIRDHGCGIPAADLPRLFTAFYRGSNVGQTSGSGLGLVITKRCVDLHGGTIKCESAEGAGTTFIVTLPLFDGACHFRRLGRNFQQPQFP